MTLATFPDLERFKQLLHSGRRSRTDWGLWCWLCDEPQVVAFGQSPLIECSRCHETSYAHAKELEELLAPLDVETRTEETR